MKWIWKKEKKENKADEKIRIAQLIRKVEENWSSERAAKCGYDCLLQWEAGCLSETIAAWEDAIVQHKTNNSGVMAQRNGAWVPAIPM